MPADEQVDTGSGEKKNESCHPTRRRPKWVSEFYIFWKTTHWMIYKRQTMKKVVTQRKTIWLWSRGLVLKLFACGKFQNYFTSCGPHHDMSRRICTYIYIYLFIHSFICLFIYLCIHLFIHSFIYLFIYSFIYSFIYLFILFIYLFIYSFIYLFIYLFIYPLIYIYAYISV